MLPMLSIIIPTLNAGQSLTNCLNRLGSCGMETEVIVVDGGSSDDSRARARNFGAHVVTSDSGRGRQMIAGAEHATGNWLLFLHADTLLGETWARAVTDFQNRWPDRAGYFDFAFQGTSFRNKIWARGVALRCALFKFPYGDQGLLIPRTLYDQVGGFRALPFLEDIDLVRRLGRRRLIRIYCTAFTAADRFERDGYFRRSAKNILIVVLHACGVSPAKLVKLYR